MPEEPPAPSRFPPVALPPNPRAAEVQRFCLSLPGAWEDYPWGDIVFKVGTKMFATLGGDERSLGMTLKASRDDAGLLTQLPHIRRAAYIGQHGWVTVEVADDATLEHAKELIAGSYALVSRPNASRRRR